MKTDILKNVNIDLKYYKNSSSVCDNNLILRFFDYAMINPEWFVSAEKIDI